MAECKRCVDHLCGDYLLLPNRCLDVLERVDQLLLKVETRHERWNLSQDVNRCDAGRLHRLSGDIYGAPNLLETLVADSPLLPLNHTLEEMGISDVGSL